MNELANPRAGIGDNTGVDYARIETERLNDEYAGLKTTLENLASVAALRVGDPVEDDATTLQVGALIKRFRDLDARMEQTRVVEVEPHLRRQNAINSFFKGLQKIIQPADKQERRTTPGWIDQLQRLIDDHQARKEAAERERLRLAELERQRVAREAEEKARRERAAAERLAREAEEAQRAAERARNAEKIAEKQAAAQAAAQAADEAAARAAASAVQSQASAEDATDARIATLAKPADLVRTRGVTEEGAGVLLTTAKEPYAYVVDRRLLSAAKLFPFFNDGEVEKAVRAFARSTHHDEPMEGAEIGWKRKGVTR
jgi:hypothetical protein